MFSAIAEVFDRFSGNAAFTWYQYNDEKHDIPDKSIKNLNELLETAPKTDVIMNASSETHHNQLLYIYTSGTTGLPKAAVITHSRYIFIAAGIHFMANFKPEDIFYTPLPLYHTAGGVMSVGQALLFGSTVVIRKKFSASGYFPDCQKYKCTVSPKKKIKILNIFLIIFHLLGCSIHWRDVPLYLGYTIKFS